MPRTSRFYTRAAMRHRMASLERQADAAFMREDFDEADRLAEQANGYRIRLDKWDM